MSGVEYRRGDKEDEDSGWWRRVSRFSGVEHRKERPARPKFGGNEEKRKGRNETERRRAGK